MTGGKLARFYGVGVGPGDPELLTLKAHRILKEAPVVCVPKTGLQEDGYAFSIIRELLDPARQEIVELVFPMTQDRRRLEAAWETALSAIMDRLAQGKDTAFITEGDPLLYSTFIYLLQLIGERHPEIPVEIVPGVSSITAAAARANLPLVNRDERLAVLPATYEGALLRQTLQDFDAVVLTKVNSVFDRVLDLLEEMGLVDKAVYLKKATSSEEEIVRDIRQLRGRKLEYLSLLLVRK